MKISINNLLIIAALIMFAYLVSPLFKAGIPVNIDQAPHYLREYCLSQSGIAPNNWCPYTNAGVPTSQYYYPFVDQLIVLLGKFIGLLLSYKIFLVIALLMPPIGAYLLLKDRNRFAATVAFCLLLFYTAGWHGGGFEETLLVGFWHYMMTVGFLFVCLSFFIRLINEPNKKNLLFAVIFTPFIIHPMTILIGAPCYAAILLFNYKKTIKHIKQIIQFAAFAFFLNAFYWMPLLAKMKYLPSALGGHMPLNEFYTYILKAIPWYFTAFAIISLLFVLFLKDKENYNVVLLFSLIWALTLLSLFDTPLKAVLPGIRTGAFAGTITIIMASLLFEYLYRMKISALHHKSLKFIKATIIILAIILIAITFKHVIGYRGAILLSEREDFKPQVEMYKSLQALPQGRILAEDTLYNFGNYAQSYTHMHSLIPILINKEIIGFGTYLFPKFSLISVANGNLFGEQIEKWDYDELRDIFDSYNIKYILAHTPRYIDYFVNKSMNYAVAKPFVLFDTGIDGSYFKITNGKIISSDYQGRYAKAAVEIAKDKGKATILFKVNYYPNWKAYFDGVEVKTYSCHRELICADITENGTIEFKYRLIAVDYIGYFMTALTISWLIYFWRKK